MTDNDNALTECMARHSIIDMGGDARAALQFLRGRQAHKQRVADDGLWDAACPVALA